MAMTSTNSILIIDDDEVIRNLVANYFKRMGVAAIDLAEDGNRAWDYLTTKQYDFIVLDWKLPNLGGLALFNRIRSRATYITTPILVVSGFLEKNDFRLLQEFPCTTLVEKPFTEAIFQTSVDDLLKESVWYGQNIALIDSLLQAVSEDGKKAEALIKQVMNKAPNPIPLAVTACRRLIRSKMFKPAEKILREILKRDQDCIMAMNELGRILHLQGKHADALEVLRSANKISPQNLKRLCLVGELELNLNDPDSARRRFEKVLEIDPEHRKARAGLTIANNMSEVLSASPERVSESFASMMNSMGVAMVRTGNFAKGIDQYRSALAFLHSDEDSARVSFNLGLGYLRWGQQAKALQWFQRSEQLGQNFLKSAGYVRKLLKNGAHAAIIEEEEVLISKQQVPSATNATAPKVAAFERDEQVERPSDAPAFGAMSGKSENASPESQGQDFVLEEEPADLTAGQVPKARDTAIANIEVDDDDLGLSDDDHDMAA